MTRKKSSKTARARAASKRPEVAAESAPLSAAPPLLGTVIRAGGGFYEVDPHGEIAPHFDFSNDAETHEYSRNETGDATAKSAPRDSENADAMSEYSQDASEDATSETIARATDATAPENAPDSETATPKNAARAAKKASRATDENAAAPREYSHDKSENAMTETAAHVVKNKSRNSENALANAREYSQQKVSAREAMQAVYAELKNENEGAPTTLLCRARGLFNKGVKTASQPISVGDEVRVRPLPSFGPDARGRRLREGYIEEVLPRRGFLGRARFNKTAQVTVANLDQVVIVMSLREPELNLHRLDRFLVLAEASNLRAVICLNKSDLLKKRALTSETKSILSLYRDLGYETILTSAEKDAGIEELRAALSGHISAVLGSSGVGKSSLINAVQPGLHLWVGDVMEIGKGRHTTTEVSLHKLDGGGYIADTPGIKTVALLEREELNVAQCFPEFREYSPNCRFNNCRHDKEPGCAVRAAAEAEKIAPSRYESYLRILNSPLTESSVFVSLLR